MARAEQNERAFSFVRLNQWEAKPRSRGLTEIRGLAGFLL